MAYDSTADVRTWVEFTRMWPGPEKGLGGGHQTVTDRPARSQGRGLSCFTPPASITWEFHGHFSMLYFYRLEKRVLSHFGRNTRLVGVAHMSFRLFLSNLFLCLLGWAISIALP